MVSLFKIMSAFAPPLLSPARPPPLPSRLPPAKCDTGRGPPRQTAPAGRLDLRQAGSPSAAGPPERAHGNRHGSREGAHATAPATRRSPHWNQPRRSGNGRRGDETTPTGPSPRVAKRTALRRRDADKRRT